MSIDDRIEFRALEELKDVLENLKVGAADWRRRALKAEAEHSELGAGVESLQQREQLLQLEAENEDLNQRLEVARQRVEDLLSRLRFLEEQVALEEHGT